MTTAQLVWHWGEVDASRTDDALILAHRRTGAEAWVRDGRVVRGAGYDCAATVVRHELARTGAIVRLRERGRYLVHASGAVDPSGRAWILSGDSGAGKSTLAYALARSGWSILGDDGVPIEMVGSSVIAHGWRGPLAVSRELRSEFPELSRFEHARADGRQRVPIAVPTARSAPVAALVFLRRARRFSIERLTPVATLAALVRQSPWVILDDAHSRAHLEALRRTSTLPAFSLGHTPDELHSIATVLEALLS
jgi:hypothetical protein